MAPESTLMQLVENLAREMVGTGAGFNDTMTPWEALLTRISRGCAKPWNDTKKKKKKKTGHVQESDAAVPVEAEPELEVEPEVPPDLPLGCLMSVPRNHHYYHYLCDHWKAVPIGGEALFAARVEQFHLAALERAERRPTSLVEAFFSFCDEDSPPVPPVESDDESLPRLPWKSYARMSKASDFGMPEPSRVDVLRWFRKLEPIYKERKRNWERNKELKATEIRDAKLAKEAAAALTAANESGAGVDAEMEAVDESMWPEWNRSDSQELELLE
jgi:hypothetical protein